MAGRQNMASGKKRSFTLCSSLLRTANITQGAIHSRLMCKNIAGMIFARRRQLKT